MMRSTLWLLADAAGSFGEEIAPAASPSYEGAFLRLIFTVLGLLALLIITIWFLRRLQQGRLGGNINTSTKSIKILERRPLSPKSMLYLVEIAGKRIVLSESQFEVRSHTVPYAEPCAKLGSPAHNEKT